MRLRTFAIATAATALALAPLAAQSDEPMPASTDPVVEETADVQPADSAAATSESTALESPSSDASTVELETSAEATEPASTGLEVEDTDAWEDAYAEANIPQETVNEPSELPRTASPLALLALLGAGGIGSAAGLRLARRR